MSTADNTDDGLPSFQAQLQALDVDQQISRVRGVSPDARVGDLARELGQARERLHNVLSPAIARAKKRTGHEYLLEIGAMTSGTTHRPFAVAVITRIA